MSYTSDFGRYQHVAGSVAISALGDGFKVVGAAVWGAGSSVARVVAQTIRDFDASWQERRQVRAHRDLSAATLRDIGLPRSGIHIHHVVREATENPGVDYRVFSQ